MTDIHYGIRWLKTRADTLDLRVDKVGALGVSSGGHQAMLLAMRPNDPRYAGFKPPYGATDAEMSLDYVIMCWPVIDPLARYHYAKGLRDGGEPYPELVDRVPALPRSVLGRRRRHGRRQSGAGSRTRRGG